MKIITPFTIAVSAALLFACGKSDEAPAPATSAPAATTEAMTAAPAVAVEPTAPATEPAPASPSAVIAASPAAEPAAPKVAAATPAEAAPAAPAADLVHGQKIYRQACAFCHDKGVAGAPKTGDAAVWGARLAQGMDTLYTVALRGKGGMPAKGGNPSLSEADVKAAVDYMIAQSR